MLINTRTLTVALLLLSLSPASHALQRADLLPKEAQIHFNISDTTAAISRLKSSTFGRMLEDRQMQEFLELPKELTLEQLFFDGEPDAEQQVFIQQIKMLNGEVALGGNLEDEQPYLVATMSKEDFEFSLELDEKLAGTMEDPFEIINDTFQGVRMIRHVKQGGTSDEESYWQAHVENTFVMGTSREWVEKCIVLLKQESPTEPKGEPTISLTIPIGTIIQQLLIDEMGADPEDKQILEAIGFLDIQRLKLTASLNENEIVIDNHLRITDLNKGLFKLLDTRPAELPTDSFISNDMLMLEVFRFNLLELWKEIPTLIRAIEPDAMIPFDIGLAMIRDQTGIDLEQDLLNHIGNRLFAFGTIDQDVETGVLAIDLKDATAFRRGIEKLFSSPNFQPLIDSTLERETFLEHTLYTSKETPPEETITFGVAGSYLLFGNPNGIRQAVRSMTSENAANTALEQNPLIQGLRTHVPANAFNFAAIDISRYIQNYIDLLNNSGFLFEISNNPEKLPPANHIAKFFGKVFQYTEKTSDGIHQRIIIEY